MKGRKQKNIQKKKLFTIEIVVLLLLSLVLVVSYLDRIQIFTGEHHDLDKDRLFVVYDANGGAASGYKADGQL